LKYSAKKEIAKNEQFLSVNCPDRSVDLFFDTKQERDNWRDILNILVNKEHCQLGDIDILDPPINAPDFERIVLYSSVGKRFPKMN
jgi:hypothetical protein